MGVQAAVRMLLEHADGIEGVASELHQERQHLAEDLKKMGQSDQAKVQELEEELVVVCESSESEAEMRAIFADIDAVIRTEPSVGEYDQTI